MARDAAESGDMAHPAYRLDGAGLLLRHLREGPLTRLEAAASAPLPDLAMIEELTAEIGGVLDGLRLYQTHPYRRCVPGARTFWTRGSTRVIDYGGDGMPILVVPSMINRATIMDLTIEESRMRWLARNGFRPFLFDWGEPGKRESQFTIGRYLVRRLRPAFDAILRHLGGPVHLAGYCMGGPIALALAATRPDSIGGVVTLGTPWDFDHFPEHDRFRDNQKALEASLMTMGALYGAIPPQVAQSFFAMRDLASGARKFRRFATRTPDCEDARRFVAIEDWLNDGVAVPLPVAMECFSDWLVGNALLHGTWRIDDGMFDPAEIRAPVMVVAGTRDSVVPPSSALALADAIGSTHVLSPATGHLGIVLGEQADRTVWHPVRDFLMENHAVNR